MKRQKSYSKRNSQKVFYRFPGVQRLSEVKNVGCSGAEVTEQTETKSSISAAFFN